MKTFFLFPQDQVAVSDQQLTAQFKGGEHTLGQFRVVTGPLLACNPEPLIGNAPRAFGSAPIGRFLLGERVGRKARYPIQAGIPIG